MTTDTKIKKLEKKIDAQDEYIATLEDRLDKCLLGYENNSIIKVGYVIEAIDNAIALVHGKNVFFTNDVYIYFLATLRQKVIEKSKQ